MIEKNFVKCWQARDSSVHEMAGHFSLKIGAVVNIPVKGLLADTLSGLLHKALWQVGCGVEDFSRTGPNVIIDARLLPPGRY